MEVAARKDYKALYEDSLLIISTLRHELDQLKKMVFGTRSERFVPAPHPSQLSLDIVAETLAAPAVISTQQIAYTRTITEEKKPIVHPGRAPLPEHLRREEIILEPDSIPQGAKRIGEEVTEELEYQPGELYVNRYVRPKYASPAAEDGKTSILIAPTPVRPLEKAIAGPGLLAQVVIDKYADHLPLHRQMQRFERGKVSIAYSTLTDWVSGTCALIAPLYEALKEQILASGYIHADETTIKVLDKDKKGKSHQGYFWVYNNSPGRLVFFDYQPGRDKAAPEGILKEYKGYLQTDGYVAYDGFEGREKITQLHCMAHARRKFVEAAANDKDRSEHVLGQMQVLYAIERRSRDEALSYEQRLELRQQEAMPILNELGKWMKEQYLSVTPKSPIGEALAYSIRRWDKLSLYTTNGMLCIDNNPVENSIRPVALGRKNYLFCGSHEAAQRTAMLYSLLGTCKMHGINPTDWLKDVLQRIPAHPINRITELLPQNWKPRQS